MDIVSVSEAHDVAADGATLNDFAADVAYASCR